MIIKQDGAVLTVCRPNDEHENKSLHGLTRTLLHNMVVGVEKGFSKELEVNGVGYRASKEGNKLVLNVRRGPGAEQDRRQRHRQAEGRTVCCKRPWKETPGTL